MTMFDSWAAYDSEQPYSESGAKGREHGLFGDIMRAKPANGVGINGSDYYYDATIGAAWVWNPSTGTLISTDSPHSVEQKAKYVLDNNLGGLFAWEIDGDSGTILNAMNEGLGNKAQ